MRVSLYIRLPVDKHRRFCAYARRVGVSANQAAEMMVDQVLAQTDPTFEWPDWLVEAVEEGLPIQRPASADEEEGEEISGSSSTGRAALRAV